MTTPIPPGRLTSADLVKLKYFLIENISRAMEGEALPVASRRDFVLERLKGIYSQTKLQLPDDIRNQVFKEVLDELLGYGPIQPLLDDDDVSEVMVNGPKKV